jgi:2-polyprenyl-3-methyl-5-hydroxy-6-metoxy-1,4-benzoquinol methylase
MSDRQEEIGERLSGGTGQSQTMEEIKCIFCTHDHSRVVIEEGGYRCRKCSSCGLIYVSPRPPFSEIQKLYDCDQAHLPAEARIEGFHGKRLRALHHLRIIKKFISDGSLMEIGPGAGSFLYEARRKGFEVHGIELNCFQASFIRNQLNISCEGSSLDDTSFGGKKFDVIYSEDVLSHFYDPIEELNKIRNKLKDSGFFIFETGNLGDVKEKYFKLFPSFQLPEHLFSFGEENLKELLRRTGFEFLGMHKYSKLPLLLITKSLKKAIDLFASREEKMDLNKDRISASKRNGFRFSNLVRNAYHYFSYFMLYKIGCLMPKKGRPQSLIVIARKKIAIDPD